MDATKLKEMLRFYDTYLEEKNISVKEQEYPLSRTDNLEHVRYMCNKALHFVEENRIKKAMRWLGFIQGVLFVELSFSISELKNHSRS